MVNAVGSDDQIWQEGIMEDTLELTTITSSETLKDVPAEVCKLCGTVTKFEGVSANDIRSRTDGTRVITGFHHR